MNWTRLGRDADHPAGIARYLERGDTLYIWCGGTRNRREWRENFQPLKQWLYAGGLARVNAKDYQQALDVSSALPIGMHFGKRVWIGGYSRGYAIALILAYNWSHHAKSISVMGFAGKRCGNKMFHKRLDDMGIGYVNTSYRWDVVPWLPPWYARGPQRWVRAVYGPVAAHIEAAKLAAMWRHVQTEEEL